MACKAIGIDLGTTYSRVAVVKNGHVEVVTNHYNSKKTHSVVAFTDTGILVGHAAEYQRAINPTNTVYGIKQLLGRRFSDKCFQLEMKNWSYNVIADKEDNPLIKIQLGGTTTQYKPEQICSELLKKLINTAESVLGHDITDAVITIPAHYGDTQRQATFESARLAGINVLRLINEPTAAALVYGIGEDMDADATRTILVYDMGASTLDVSIMKISRQSFFEVLGTAGDSHLGGNEFDNHLVAHFVNEFKQNSGRDVSSDKRTIRRLTEKCEMAKRFLSENSSNVVEIDCLFKNADLYGKLTRVQWEIICQDLFAKALVLVDRALKNAQLDKDDINEIVLAGGSSNIPKIQQLLKDFFGHKKLNTKINPGESVAYGAALLAAKLSGDKSRVASAIQLTDITGSTLSIENTKKESVVVIPKGTRTPIGITTGWETAFDNATTISFSIYEGDEKLVKHNNFLGVFAVSGFPSRPKGEVKFDVAMKIDADGILTVTAVERSTGIKNEVTFAKRMAHSTAPTPEET